MSGGINSNPNCRPNEATPAWWELEINIWAAGYFTHKHFASCAPVLRASLLKEEAEIAVAAEFAMTA